VVVVWLEVLVALPSGAGVCLVSDVVLELFCSVVVGAGEAGAAAGAASFTTTGVVVLGCEGVCWQATIVNPISAAAAIGAYRIVKFFIIKVLSAPADFPSGATSRFEIARTRPKGLNLTLRH
jgi:hypothetical protein